MMQTTLDIADAARFLASYAKDHGAGAFATPPAKELEAAPAGTVLEWTEGGRTVAVVKRLTRHSVRTDFSGRSFGLPAGALIVAYIAREPDAAVPDLSFADYVFAYREDAQLSAGLEAQGRAVAAVRVSAAAEIIACWAGPEERFDYPAWDRATIAELSLGFPEELRTTAVGEVEAIGSWADDFPFYSDGSWSAVSLRGFWPDDPARGIKPSEMPKAWKADHPADVARTCEWTTMAERCPAIVGWIASVPWWRRLERVRLLQMGGMGGKGGALARHSDVTDRAAGTKDGQIARFHVPIVTDPRIVMQGWTLEGELLERHLEPWHTYYLDARKPHAVVNPTGVDRVHLVVDVVVDPEVREEIGLAT